MTTVKVKRDGPRGWHFIARAKYDADPSAYELFDAAPAEDMAALREAYQEKIGKKPFHGWGADTLKAKIAE